MEHVVVVVLARVAGAADHLRFHAAAPLGRVQRLDEAGQPLREVGRHRIGGPGHPVNLAAVAEGQLAVEIEVPDAGRGVEAELAACCPRRTSAPRPSSRGPEHDLGAGRAGDVAQRGGWGRCPRAGRRRRSSSPSPPRGRAASASSCRGGRRTRPAGCACGCAGSRSASRSAPSPSARAACRRSRTPGAAGRSAATSGRGPRVGPRVRPANRLDSSVAPMVAPDSAGGHLHGGRRAGLGGQGGVEEHAPHDQPAHALVGAGVQVGVDQAGRAECSSLSGDSSSRAVVWARR